MIDKKEKIKKSTTVVRKTENIGEKRLHFYEILRKRISKFVGEYTGETGNKISGFLFTLPDFFILLCRLAIDKRVTTSQKAFIGGIITYVILPIDIIPDFIPVLGYVDDLVLVIYGLNLILNELDETILRDNWSGEEDILELMQKITFAAENFLNKNFIGKIKSWLNSFKR